MKNRKLVKAMKSRGWDVEMTRNNHLRFIHKATGQYIIFPSSASCPRAEKNHWATVRKIEDGSIDMRKHRTVKAA